MYFLIKLVTVVNWWTKHIFQPSSTPELGIFNANFISRNLSVNRAPDTYVKLSLVSSTGQELAHSKTSVQRGQPNPLFKETFIFQVSERRAPRLDAILLSLKDI